MKKGLTIGQKRILFILAGFLIFLGAFLLIYQKNMEQVDALEQDTAQKTNQVNFLTTLQLRINEMNQTTEEKQQMIEAYTQEYPSQMTQQKAIYNVYRLSVDSGVTLRSISPGSETIFFQNGELVGSDGEESSSDVESGELSEAEKNPETKVSLDQMVGKVTDYELELSGSRKQILKAFDWISENEEPMSLSNISLSFDSSTGKLTGTIVVNFYCLNGNGKPYEDPDISGIVLGNKDVFGTFKSKSKSK